jgi:hypothetical protein
MFGTLAYNASSLVGGVTVGSIYTNAPTPAAASASSTDSGDSNSVSLAIASIPGSVVSPAVGTNNCAYDTTLTPFATSPYVCGATQYVCTGATVEGNDFSQGNNPTTVSLTLTNAASLTWNWQTQYQLTTVASGSGGVTLSGWFAADSNVVLTATPGAKAHLSGWTGATNGCIVSGNTLTAPMTQARAITAVFASGAAPFVAGKVTQSGTSKGVAGVTITFSGGAGAVTTDGNGSYSNTVPYKWNGTATASFSTGGFATPTITYNSLTANQTGKNYTWSPSPTISGKVTKSGTSTGVPGVKLTFASGTNNIVVVTTDSGGNYSNVVAYGWNGTVTPTNTAGGVFSPVSKTYSKVTAKQTQSYTWTPPPVISGKVTKSGTSTGVAAKITASNGGGAATTDASGNYTLTVPYNWTGVLTASATSGGTFSPASKSFTAKLTASKTAQNFVWTAVASAAKAETSTTTDVTAPVDGFAQWALLHGLDDTVSGLFDQDNGAGVSYGTEYAFGANLTKGEPLLQLLTVNGIHTAVVPLQDPATETDAKVTVESSLRSGSGVWILAVPVPTPLPDGATKQWYQALYGNAAGFRVTVQQIK